MVCVGALRDEKAKKWKTCFDKLIKFSRKRFGAGPWETMDDPESVLQLR